MRTSKTGSSDGSVPSAPPSLATASTTRSRSASVWSRPIHQAHAFDSTR